MTLIEVINNAFSSIGHDVEIESFEEDSREGRLARRFYKTTLENIAAGWDWPFLIRRPDVVADSQGGITIPADCIRVVSLTRNGFSVDPMRRGGKLYVENAGAYERFKLTYISGDFLIEDAPITFQTALVTALAEAFVGPIAGGDANKLKLARQAAAQALNRAQNAANRDQRNPGNDPDHYIKARW